MARVKRLRNYPLSEYRALFERVERTQESQLIPCTRTQAASLRGELYAFRTAVARDPDDAASLGLNPDAIAQMTFQIREEGLIVMPTSLSQTASLIRAALGTEVAPLPNPAAESLERLRALVNADKG